MVKLNAAKGLAAMLLGGVAMSAAGTANAQDVTMSMVTGSPPSHVISTGAVEPWMACVTGKVGERVKFNYFPSGQLVGNRELTSALMNGVADAVPIPVGYDSDKIPLNGVAALPGLGSSATEIMTANSAAVREAGPLADEYTAINAVPLIVMDFPPYQMVSRGPALRSLEDMKGKVIRSAGGSSTLTINALGGAPAEIAVGDTYVSMERGVVDATISGINSVKPYNLQELMKSMSTNGAFGTFTNVVAMNGTVWSKVPADIQVVMKDCGLDVEKKLMARMDAESGELIKEFASKGIDMFEYTPEQLAAMEKLLAVVHDDWVKRLADRGLPARAVLDRYKALIAAN